MAVNIRLFFDAKIWCNGGTDYFRPSVGKCKREIGLARNRRRIRGTRFQYSSDKERKNERAAVAELAFGVNRSTVRAHDVLGDGEAKAGASGLTRAGFIDAIEAFEEARQVFG